MSEQLAQDLSAPHYQWKEEAGKIDIEADAVGELIESIREYYPDTNEFYPAIVSHAKRTNSILHPFFEWDDKAAANQHRLERARFLVRMIVRVEANDPTPIRAFINVNDGGGRKVYTPDEVQKDPKLRRLVLRSAIHEALGWSNKYHMYPELGLIRNIIGSVNQQLEENDDI